MSQEANSTRTDEFKLPTKPSDDWQLNVFLTELADELTEQDLKKMKHLLTGINGTGKGVLEVIKDPLDLFQHLRQRRILTSDNITYLQAMLWHTKRKDLYNKFVKFAKRRNNIVYFYAPNDSPENGFEYIKFHIAGREKMNRHKLEELRMHVSNALCVPVEYVIASGIEATNSILVTFMVPEGYANVLSDLSNKEKEYLGSRGVDAIWYQGQLVSCIDVELSGEEECLMKDEEVKILLDQKSKLDQDVEELQIEVLTLQKTVRAYQRKNEQIAENARIHIANSTAVLIQQFLEIRYTPKTLSLKEIASANSLKYFNHMLKKMETSGYDTDLIRHLLEANQLVVLSRTRTCDQWIQTQQQKMINKLQKDVDILQYEKDKLKYYLKAGISKPVLTEAEDFFLQYLLTRVAPPPIVRTQTRVSVELEGTVDVANHVHVLVEIFKIWESTLTVKERNMIVDKFIAIASEKKKFKESKMLLLMYLWVKHSREKPGLSFDEWKVRILASIKRMDLCPVWTRKSDMVVQAFMGTRGSKVPHDLTDRSTMSKDRQRQDSRKTQTENDTKKRLPIRDSNSDILQHIKEMLQKNLGLTERLAQVVFDRSNMHSFPQKSDSDILFDTNGLYKSKLFDNSFN